MSVTRQKNITGDRASAARPDLLPFSFGAAGVTPLWLLFHGRVRFGLRLLAIEPGLFLLEHVLRDSALEPMAVVLHRGVVMAVAVTFGLHGSKIAWVQREYHTVDELKRGERHWTALGIFVVSAYVLWMLQT
jgi:hypothetical protein